MSIYKFLVFIFFISISNSIQGQLSKTTHFSSWNGGLCDESIILDSLGYFFKEKGCEGNSTISFGRYFISPNKVINFIPLPFDSLAPIREIKRRKDNNDSIITITLFDRENKPIVFAINLEAVDTSGKTVGVYSQLNGQVVLNRKQYKDLIVGPLLWIYKYQKPLITGDENVIEVYFSLPALFLTYSEIQTELPSPFKLQLKKDGLYNLKNTRMYSKSK